MVKVGNIHKRVQLSAFLCIFIVIKIDAVNEYTKHFGTSIDIRVVTMMISFCVIFGINQSFARRERTLQDIASFKSSIIMIYYTMTNIFEVDEKKKEQIFSLCERLLTNLTKYIYDRNALLDDKLHSHQQTMVIKHFYSDINKLLKLYNLISLFLIFHMPS